MKAVKYILLTLASIVALLLIIALFVPKEIVYEKSITINAPIEVVWENVSSLKAMNDWNPWSAKDPNMKQSLTGVDGTIGARHSWESDVKDVGKGYQEITKINPPDYIETALKFYDPYESEAIGYIKLDQKAANEIVVTWGFTSTMPYPFNLMSLTMNMEEMMGDDWNKGLERLKFLCEI